MKLTVEIDSQGLVTFILKKKKGHIEGINEVSEMTLKITQLLSELF